jgi:hypothetical protein
LAASRAPRTTTRRSSARPLAIRAATGRSTRISRACDQTTGLRSLARSLQRCRATGPPSPGGQPRAGCLPDLLEGCEPYLPGLEGGAHLFGRVLRAGCGGFAKFAATRCYNQSSLASCQATCSRPLARSLRRGRATWPPSPRGRPRTGCLPDLPGLEGGAQLHGQILNAGCGGRPRGRDCGKDVYEQVERLGRHLQGTCRGLGAGLCYMTSAIPHRISPRAQRTSSATPVQGWTSANTCPQGQVQRRAEHEFRQRLPSVQRLRFTGRNTELVCAASAPGAFASRGGGAGTATVSSATGWARVMQRVPGEQMLKPRASWVRLAHHLHPSKFSGSDPVRRSPCFLKVSWSKWLAGKVQKRPAGQRPEVFTVGSPQSLGNVFQSDFV